MDKLAQQPQREVLKHMGLYITVGTGITSYWLKYQWVTMPNNKYRTKNIIYISLFNK